MPNRIRIFVLSLALGLLAGCGGGVDGTSGSPPTSPNPTPPPAPPPPPTPDVPNGLRVSASGRDFIEWTWDAVEGANGYDVQFSLDEAFTGEDEIVARTSEELSFRREGLASGTSAYLRVRSASGSGVDRVTSAWSTKAIGMVTPPSGAPASAVPTATPFGPAEAGKRSPEPIGVTVLDEDGRPVAGAAYHWEADENAGWVYPPGGLTDADGRISASWVAGSPGDGILTLSVGERTSALTAELETRSVASRQHPSGAIYVVAHHSGAGTGYSVDLTPLAEPSGTFYAAIQWDGGYAGLQRGGSRYDRQLQFSQWDGPGIDARVIEAGPGVECGPFGGEGTGRKCEVNYPWSVGATYRFEVTQEDRDGGSAMTLHVTDLATDERRFVGTLFGGRANSRAFAMFVEDFRGVAPTCLAQAVRSAAIRRVRVRLDGAWQSLTSGTLGRARGDAKNPGTPACANLAARDHASGLEIAMGGRTAMDPDVIRVTIPP